jgi:recombination protein RecT
MANELVTFENMLRPLTPHFEQALAGVMPVERLMRTIMISIERNPKLLQADRQSLLNSAMSAACLGLEVDGITGQAFFVPFKNKAQLIVGYKGYNTLGARAGLTIQGEVVRQGDAFDFELGDKGFVRHKPLLGNRGKIMGAWATASALNRPPIITVLGIDEIEAIRMKSPGAKMSESPWNNAEIGYPAMASKSAKRRLARSTPLNIMQQAAALEESFEERGRISWLDPSRGLQIEGEASDPYPQVNTEQRTAEQLTGPKPEQDGPAIEAGWAASREGTEAVKRWWLSLGIPEKKRLLPLLDNDLKPAAAKVDKQRAGSLSPQGAESGAAEGGQSFTVPTTATEYVDVAHARIKADPVAARAWYESAQQQSTRKFLNVTEEMRGEIEDHLNGK